MLCIGVAGFHSTPTRFADGNCLFQQLESFGSQFGRHVREARDVASRPRERFHQTDPFWITNERHHNRDRLRCSLGGQLQESLDDGPTLRLTGPKRWREAALLRVRVEPPVGRHFHWITSSARNSTDSGTDSPSAFAVLRLTIISNLVGCSTGSSLGLAPFTIRSMK